MDILAEYKDVFKLDWKLIMNCVASHYANVNKDKITFTKYGNAHNDKGPAVLELNDKGKLECMYCKNGYIKLLPDPSLVIFNKRKQIELIMYVDFNDHNVRNIKTYHDNGNIESDTFSFLFIYPENEVSERYTLNNMHCERIENLEFVKNIENGIYTLTMIYNGIHVVHYNSSDEFYIVYNEDGTIKEYY